jgi:hypothetical protein
MMIAVLLLRIMLRMLPALVLSQVNDFDRKEICENWRNLRRRRWLFEAQGFLPWDQVA